MRIPPPVLALAAAAWIAVASVSAQSLPHGIEFSFSLDRSQVFPETHRTIHVYVPAQYQAQRPACVYLDLDGLQFDAPAVFDRLIAAGTMPVTIAIGVEPGSVASAAPPTNPRFDRSSEFDTLNGDLARFLLDEVLPEVARRGAPDGRPIRLSADPNDRAVGGASTGGIGSFTLAWQRPDAFRRVFSAIGTYVGMRGGDHYPVLVRKTEPKPIRVFLEDGAKDGWPGGLEFGDWWMSNQAMERALEFSGYQVSHAWGDGAHNNRHAEAVFPDAMRWLWQGWPTPIAAGTSRNSFLHAILLPGEAWREAPAAGMSSSQTAANPRGGAYAADPTGIVWFVSPDGKRQAVDPGLRHPSALAVSPDGLWLAVGEIDRPVGYSYRILPDGTLQGKLPFYALESDDSGAERGARAWVMDRQGRLYAATRFGVQVLDRNGRCRAIIPAPGGAVVDLRFGGADLSELAVRCADGRVFRRRLAVAGFDPAGGAIVLPPANAG